MLKDLNLPNSADGVPWKQGMEVGNRDSDHLVLQLDLGALVQSPPPYKGESPPTAADDQGKLNHQDPLFFPAQFSPGSAFWQSLTWSFYSGANCILPISLFLPIVLSSLLPCRGPITSDSFLPRPNKK